MSGLERIGSIALPLLALLCFVRPATARAETAKEVTQYGITWTFDKPYRSASS